MNPEELYSLYHVITNKESGRIVRAVKNFENAKVKEQWKHFELFASFIKKNNGQIDPRLYIKALAQNAGGWFDPKLLCTPKATLIYKRYITEVNNIADPEHIKNSLMQSIKFVIEYCRKKNITSLCEYLNEDIFLIPSVLKHLDAGSISMYFIVSIEDIDNYIINYPIDCRNDYIPNYVEDYRLYRTRLVFNKDLSKIYSNIESIIDNILQKEL